MRRLKELGATITSVTIQTLAFALKAGTTI
jgi:hypothetical protein